MKKNLHVGVLMGGFGPEKEVSLNSGKACKKALIDSGYKVTEILVDEDFDKKIERIKPNVCFNALHGEFGEDGTIQGYLNALKIPYTHSGVTTSSIAMNKIYTKNIISKITENLNEPIIFPKTLTPKELDGLDPSSKIIIKPISGGSSVGVKIKKVKEIKKVINKINYFQNMMEPLVGNRELTVTVLDNKPLTVTEILPEKNEVFYNYSAKYSTGGSLHNLPAKIPIKIFKLALKWAKKSHDIIGCNCISRTDFRFDDLNNTLFMLEINTQPGMTETSLVPEQAKFCGIAMPELVDLLVKESGCKS